MAEEESPVSALESTLKNSEKDRRREEEESVEITFWILLRGDDEGIRMVPAAAASPPRERNRRACEAEGRGGVLLRPPPAVSPLRPVPVRFRGTFSAARRDVVVVFDQPMERFRRSVGLALSNLFFLFLLLVKESPCFGSFYFKSEGFGASAIPVSRSVEFPETGDDRKCRSA